MKRRVSRRVASRSSGRPNSQCAPARVSRTAGPARTVELRLAGIFHRLVTGGLRLQGPSGVPAQAVWGCVRALLAAAVAVTVAVKDKAIGTYVDTFARRACASLGYEHCDERLWLLGRSLVTSLASRNLVRYLVPELPSLRSLALSRRVRFTNRFTEPSVVHRWSGVFTSEPVEGNPAFPSRARDGGPRACPPEPVCAATAAVWSSV